MPPVRNLAYYGQAGVVTIDGDEHFGVNAITLTPTSPEESITDVSGDVQILTGVPVWRCAMDFNQDHITDGSLSRKSPELAGTVVACSYTPQDGGEGRSFNVRWKDIVFGGSNGRQTATPDFGVIGQPVVIPPADPEE